MGSVGDRPTNRPQDHATRSVTIGGAHSGAAKLCYCLRLQLVFIGAVDSTDRIGQLQQTAAIFSCKTRHVAVYVETHYNIAWNRAFRTNVPDRWHSCLLIYWRTSCLVLALDDTQCYVPATEWCQRYLPCYLLSVSNSVCFSAHWPRFALFYWMTWPWFDDVIRPRYVRTWRRIVNVH